MKDHYATLGVERSATKDEIKKAFRKLSMEHHPDKGGDEDKFKEINEAYSVLYDDQKRQNYDHPNPFEGIFGPGGMGSGFGGFRPRPQKPDLNAPRNGQFIGIEVQLPLKTFVFGGEYKINVSFHEGCTSCGGKGFMEGEECKVCSGGGYVQQVNKRPGFVSTSMQPCPHCQGKGMTGTDKCTDCGGNGNRHVRDKEITFAVPPGAGPGTKVITKGVGRAGLNGGQNGDIGILIVDVERPNLNKLTPEQLEQLKSLLEVLDNAGKSA